MVNRTRVEGGGYSKHDIVTSVEVLALCLLVGKNLYIYCVSNWENEHLLQHQEQNYLQEDNSSAAAGPTCSSSIRSSTTSSSRGMLQEQQQRHAAAASCRNNKQQKAPTNRSAVYLVR